MKFKNALIALSLFSSATAFAGSTTGKVNLLYVHGYNDLVLISLVSTQPSFAPCAVTGRYAISTASQQGKNILSVALAAKAAGMSITIIGKNTCTAHGDAEDISAVVVN